KLFPIAMPQLCVQSGQSAANKDIPRIMGRDLDLSGYFEVLDPNAYIETPGKCVGPDKGAYSDWSVIGAEGLVRGIVEARPDGRLRVQLFLHDVQRQSVVLGKEYEGDESQIPRMAHKFANEIMKFFTGEPGVFGSQIAFSSRVGRFKELFVMDMDGSNVRQLTNEKGLAVSPAWDPQGRTLVYTSYRNRVPDLYLIDVATRHIQQLTRGDALEIGAHFSAQGGKILASSMQGRESNIVLINPDGSIYRRITSSTINIDTSPNWSPDNSKIVFVSNRAGGPQIYVMNADGSDARRISFVSSNYCTSPAWSPKGDKIAFVCRADSGFQLFVSNADGSGPMQLTSMGDNEDPDWSPDGRYLVFATTFGRGMGFNLALMRSDGTNTRQLTQSRGGDFEPAWGPMPQ
ncbi:MAG: PD40 domain-containing protein, partial [Deltaproteobacteria bacterium]|nr:PD40 domain-containing protein [Deltaproteobacteria bacterium]